MEAVTVENFVQGLNSKQLTCRRLGHPWKSHTVQRDSAGFTEVLRCPSCGTRRIDTLNRRGHVIARQYQYADGYQAKHVEGGILGQRDLFRLEALTRLVEKTRDDVPKQRRRRLASVN